MLSKLICWFFGCKPDYQAADHGYGVAPCLRCGAPDTTYEDRCGDTRYARFVGWLHRLRFLLLDSWRQKPEACPACGQRGECKPDCDGVPF